MKIDKRILILFASGAVGAIIGYAYYYFIGCNSGNSCALTSNWYVTTIYGFVAGLVLGFPSKKKQDEKN